MHPDVAAEPHIVSDGHGLGDAQVLPVVHERQRMARSFSAFTPGSSQQYSRPAFIFFDSVV